MLENIGAQRTIRPVRSKQIQYGIGATLVFMQRGAQQIERNQEYDPFARIYNRHWGVDYRLEVAPIVERLLLSRIGAGAAVLDVCCGTGQFTEQVRRRGYAVSGVDASGEMIRYARQNAPDVEFTVADVRDFSLDTRFDAAYSVYESLNHVPDIAGLTLALRRIRRHLKPGGPFLFDLNREEAYLLYWNNTDAIVENDNVCVLRSEYNEATRAARCDITAFEQSGAGEWQREDFSVRQTCHNISGAHGAVLEAGFKEVTLQDARDAGMSGDAGYARTFFLAIA